MYCKVQFLHISEPSSADICKILFEKMFQKICLSWVINKSLGYMLYQRLYQGINVTLPAPPSTIHLRETLAQTARVEAAQRA